MHGLVALFLGVIALVIIFFVVGLVAHCVLILTLTRIMALIVLMTIVRLGIIAIMSVASMVITIFEATILLVA
jgi:hypothetical protein